MRKLLATILSLSLILGPMPSAHAAMTKQLLGLGNSIVGTAILGKCRLSIMHPALKVYMLGSMTYIVSEIMAAKQKAKEIDSQALDLDQLRATMKEGGDFQKKAILSQIENEKSNLKFIQQRKKFVTATLVTYTIAAIMGTQGFGSPLCAPGNLLERPWVMILGAAYSSLMTAGKLSITGISLGLGIQAADQLIPKLLEVTALSDATIILLNSAPGRVIFFSFATALVDSILKEVDDAEKESQRRIAQLELVRDQFVAADGGLAEGELGDLSKNQYALKPLAEGKAPAKQCLSDASGALSFSEEACKSPMKVPRPTFDVSMNIPALMDAGNASADYAQAIANGDLGRADVEASKLASMSSRINAIKTDFMKKANAKLIAEGNKPLDIDADLKSQLDKMNEIISKKDSAAGTEKPNGAELSAEGTSNSGDSSKVSNVSVTNFNVGSTGLGIPAFAGNENGQEGIDTDLNANNKVNKESASMSVINSKGKDIAEDPDLSLFKQVSNRYLLNYTKIFQRKEINPPMNSLDPAQ